MLPEDAQREVFIKNIPYDITEEQLAEWCSSFGEVSKCTLKYDSNGNSRGFAFVVYSTVEGHDNILSKKPHYCKGRLLQMKSAYEQVPTNDESTNQTIDNETIYDDDEEENISSHLNSNHLISYRDDLDANFECMQIAHEHEIKILREKLQREEKLLREAEQVYHETEEDWKKVHEQNQSLRTNLVKNIMQTFNIRRDLARKIKEQTKKNSDIEQQYDMKKANQKFSK